MLAVDIGRGCWPWMLAVDVGRACGPWMLAVDGARVGDECHLQARVWGWLGQVRLGLVRLV